MAFRPGLARFRGTALGDQGAGFLIPAALLHQRILATEQDPSRALRVAARRCAMAQAPPYDGA